MSVRDNGIGIAPEKLPHVFDMFMQAAPADPRSKGGLGIGLTLVKTLVELHGGTVEARSPGAGQGTEIVVRLPDVESPATTPERPPRDGATGDPSHESRRLMVVDDNEDAANSLSMLLRLQGHAVRVLHGGEAALEAVREESPEVVLLDLGMPGMDGYETARRMRTLPGGDRIVLVALTGWGQEQDRRRSREAGFDQHLTKPVDPQSLDEVLRLRGRNH
jgi:CheY-like chemotaxis protein